MPLSPRSRMKKYREKMSDEKKELMKKQNNIQQAKCRQKWSCQRRKEEQAKNTIIQRQNRALKKAKDKILDKTPTSPAGAFGSRQAIGKAVKKVIKSLPDTPKRRAAVLTQIATKSACLVKDPICRKELFPETTAKQKVIEFYNRDDISRQLPGKKDYITVKDKGEKQQLQKKVLLLNIAEAYQVFKSENEDIKIGKSTFFRMRPQNVCPVSDKDQNVCACPYHENFDLLLQGLRKKISNVPDAEEVVKRCVCNDKDVRCFLRQCEQCPAVEDVIQDLLHQCSERTVFCFAQWNKKSVKEVNEMDFHGTSELLIGQLKQLVRHHFISKHQLKEVRLLKDNLDGDTVVLQEDFAENFTIKQQNEVMSAHWKASDSGNNVTVFTAIIYKSGKEHQSFAIVSDRLEHDKYSVATFNQVIFREAEKMGYPLQSVHVFSDGAGSQFKNCFNLSVLTAPNFLHENIGQIDWSFFATSHGKGPIDGIGATVKRAVWRRILQNRVVINSAQEFHEVAVDACPEVKVLFVSSEEIDAVKQQLDDLWLHNPPRTIPNTRKFHYFKAISDKDIQTCEISDFSQCGQLTVQSFQVLQNAKNIRACAKKVVSKKKQN